MCVCECVKGTVNRFGPSRKAEKCYTSIRPWPFPRCAWWEGSRPRPHSPCRCPGSGNQTNCRIRTGWRRTCRSSRRCWTWRSCTCGAALKGRGGRGETLTAMSDGEGGGHSRQAMSSREQWTEGTHRLEEPVSNTTVKGWGGVPRAISP